MAREHRQIVNRRGISYEPEVHVVVVGGERGVQPDRGGERRDRVDADEACTVKVPALLGAGHIGNDQGANRVPDPVQVRRGGQAREREEFDRVGHRRVGRHAAQLLLGRGD